MQGHLNCDLGFCTEYCKEVVGMGVLGWLWYELWASVFRATWVPLLKAD